MKKALVLMVLAISAMELLTACGSSSSDTGGLRGVTEEEYEEARQAVIDADREWRDENLF